MAGKKLNKNIDLASGFFSNISTSDASSTKEATTIVAPTMTSPSVKKENLVNQKQTADKIENRKQIGRPQKEGLKNKQYTLTMDPELYEKLKIIARDHTRGNFSALIDEAVKSYCKENNINLSDIKVDPQILEYYKKQQNKKAKKG